MLGELKIAFLKVKGTAVISDSFSKKVQHLLPPDRWPLKTVYVFTVSISIGLMFWELLLRACWHCYRACWGDIWPVGIRGHICELKVNDNQFVTYNSSSSHHFSSTASSPYFFLVPSSHRTFSSHLHFLVLKKKRRKKKTQHPTVLPC